MLVGATIEEFTPEFTKANETRLHARNGGVTGPSRLQLMRNDITPCDTLFEIPQQDIFKCGHTCKRGHAQLASDVPDLAFVNVSIINKYIKTCKQCMCP